MRCWTARRGIDGCTFKTHVGTERGKLSHMQPCGGQADIDSELCEFHKNTLHLIELLRESGKVKKILK